MSRPAPFKLPVALEPLTKHPWWVGWVERPAEVKGKKPRKLPLQPLHPSSNAKVNDPTTWGTYAQARKALANGCSWKGIGVNIRYGYAALDLDNCRPETGKVVAWAQLILDKAKVADAYVEITPSGRGFRIIGAATGDLAHRRFVVGPDDQAVEIYRGSCGRYITISGDEVGQCAKLPNIDAIVDEQLAALEKNGRGKGKSAGKGTGDGTGSGLFYGEVCGLAKRGYDPAQIEAEIEGHLKKYEHTAAERYSSEGRLSDQIDSCYDRWLEKEGVKSYEEWCRKTGRAPRRVKSTGEATAAEPSDGPLFDPWEKYVVPQFPLDVLPEAAQRFVTTQAGVIGCDASALAMAVLAAFSGALDHTFGLRMMRHGPWWASPRLWLLLVGDSGCKKTPAVDAATRPLERHQQALGDEHEAECRAAADSEAKEAPKKPPRFVVFDTTTEALGVILSRQTRGLLVKRDEIAAWIASMERYASKSRTSGADRGFWLQAANGGHYTYDRIGRGEIRIGNLSVSLIGGIQPARLVELQGLTSDGLLQRFIPVMMRSTELPQDRASNDEEYGELIGELIAAKPDRLIMQQAALQVMNDLREHLHQLGKAAGGVADGFQAFVSKLDGVAGTLALLLHMAADPRRGAARAVRRETVEDARRLVVEFVLPHSLEFYRTAEGTEGEWLRKLASWILTNGNERILASDLTRNIADLRGLSLFDVNRKVSPLVAAGWLEPEDVGLTRAWIVSAGVFARFAERAKEEDVRKRKLAELMGSTRRSSGPE